MHVQAAEVEGDDDASAVPAGANIEDEPGALRDINFDEGLPASFSETCYNRNFTQTINEICICTPATMRRRRYH